MEFKSVVFNAARDGKLRRLKVFLDHRPREEVQLLVSARTNGATPLVMAARNGHLDVVEYLLYHCHADIEQSGSVCFDGETIEGAPPLWCAAAAGHCDVARSLVQNGACVNSTTRTNSTPLRGACFDGHADIVEYLTQHGADVEVANRHGHTCLMIACYKGHYKIAKYLIELGADVNRKSVKGNTALHDCAESGSLEIMKLLLDHGAKMDVDSYGMSPLLAASVTGHTPTVEFLISVKSLCTARDLVDALELLGATYVDKKRDIHGALGFWRRAMIARHAACDLVSRRTPSAAYDNAVEVASLEQLNELPSDPDNMRMQALLIRERILGPAHPDTSYYIRYRGAVYADCGNFDRCIGLWMYALDMQQKILEPLSPMTQSSLLSFAELFSFMMSESGPTRGLRVPKICFEDLMTVFVKALREIEVGSIHLSKISVAKDERGTTDTTYFNRTLVIAMHFICLLCRLQPHVSPLQAFQLRKAVYEFVRMDPKGRDGWRPLHLACTNDSSSVGRYPICTFPSIDVIRLLLEVGADPQATDDDRNTPLHVAATSRPVKPDVLRMLLDHGSHLDACNADGRTCAQLLEIKPGLLNAVAITDIVNPLDFTTLQCLAAKVIVNTNIDYERSVPKRLAAFVAMH